MKKIMRIALAIRSRLYTFLLRLILGINVKRIHVASFKKININGEISIGDDFFSGESLYISTNKFCTLHIGEKVMFGPEVMVLGGNHAYTYNKGHLKDYVNDDHMTRDISIGDGVWIGARTIVLSGAQISEGSIVGAGSLVLNYVPPYVIAVGSPAKKFVSRFNKQQLIAMLDNVKSNLTFNQIELIYRDYGIEFRHE